MRNKNWKTTMRPLYRIRPDINNRQGLTLIEIIVTLVIAGMLAAIAGVGIVNLSGAFVASRQNTEVAQKVQLALTRISKELGDCTNIELSPQSDLNQITFEPRRNPGSNYRFTWSGTPGDNLILDTGGGNQDILIDNVKEFKLQYVTYASGSKSQSDTPTQSNDLLISVNLTSNQIGGLGFSVDVALNKHE